MLKKIIHNNGRTIEMDEHYANDLVSKGKAQFAEKETKPKAEKETKPKAEKETKPKAEKETKPKE